MAEARAVTSHVGRLYVFAVSVFVFFLMWALVAAKPWPTAQPSPQAQLIALREQALRRETKLVNRILRERAAAAKARSRQLAAAAPAPAVRVVTLPPLTITRTS
jgi:hypothetical protein